MVFHTDILCNRSREIIVDEDCKEPGAAGISKCTSKIQVVKMRVPLSEGQKSSESETGRIKSDGKGV